MPLDKSNLRFKISIAKTSKYSAGAKRWMANGLQTARRDVPVDLDGCEIGLENTHINVNVVEKKWFIQFIASVPSDIQITFSYLRIFKLFEKKNQLFQFQI